MGVAEIKEHIHYEWDFEDIKHALYIVDIHDEIEEWIKNNINGEWHIERDEFTRQSRHERPYLVFDSNEDAMAFILRWL